MLPALPLISRSLTIVPESLQKVHPTENVPSYDREVPVDSVKEENEYKNGVFVRKTKDFVKNEMIEYNENGDKIYQGGYMRNSSY